MMETIRYLCSGIKLYNMKKILLIIALVGISCLSYAGMDNFSQQVQTKKTLDTIQIKNVKSFGKDSSKVLKNIIVTDSKGNPFVLVPVDTTQNEAFSEK